MRFIGSQSKAAKVKHSPLTREEFLKVDFKKIAPERWWGDAAPDNLVHGLKIQAELLKKRFPTAVGATHETAPDSNALVISGGGADGAFGVGILDGWTKSGERPEFEFVTGISTGAMIAPFAFLGSDYDAMLVEAYSSISAKSIFKSNGLRGLIFGSSMNDTTPLRNLVEKYITNDFINEVAKETRKGRSLSIITTQFDILRPVVWDIGSIALNRGEDALPLIHNIILASAAIPGMFPPVAMEWEVEGKKFTELHVDGAVSSQIFAYPSQITVDMIDEITGLKFNRRLYVIQNHNAYPAYEKAPVTTLQIIKRALSGVMFNQLNKDIERIYYLTKRDDTEFYMIDIPSSYNADGASKFDPMYMNELIELGRSIGSKGNFWAQRPTTMIMDDMTT